MLAYIQRTSQRAGIWTILELTVLSLSEMSANF